MYIHECLRIVDRRDVREAVRFSLWQTALIDTQGASDARVCGFKLARF